MKSQVKNTKWMYMLGGLVFVSGLVILWLLGKNKKPCSCKDSDKSGNVSKGSRGKGATNNTDNIKESVDELKKLLVEKGNDNCGC
ncbi:hypothetical protein [Flagellimonas sp. 2504JD4-2]